MADRVGKQGRPVIFYIHPREIDPNHPHLPMGVIRAFKSYVNLGSTFLKLERVVAEFEVTTFQNFLEIHRPEFAARCTQEARGFRRRNKWRHWDDEEDNLWTA